MDDNMLPYILDRRDDCRHRGSKGMAATGIGLAAGLRVCAELAVARLEDEDRVFSVRKYFGL